MSIAAWRSSRRLGNLVANIALLLILLLSAYLQFTVVANTEVISPYRADAREYFFSAYNLDHYGVYSSQVTWPPEQQRQAPSSDAQVVPGYPLFLRLVGHPEPTIEYEHRIMRVQAALAVISVWLVYAIVARFLPRSWACMTAFFVAISPHLIVSSTYVLTESVFFFLILTSILGTLHAIESGGRWRFFLAGIAWGVSAMVRSTTLFVAPLFLLAACTIPRLKPWRTQAAVLMIGFVLALSPWWIRNAQMPPQHPQTSKLVNFLLHGSYPGFMYDHQPESFGDPYRYDPNAAEYGRSISSALAHIAQNFRDDPMTNLHWYLLGKPGYFLSWTNIDGAGDVFVFDVAESPYFNDRFVDTTHRISFWLHWPFMLIGLIGACLPWWRPQRWGLAGRALVAARIVSLIVFYSIAFHMIGAPYPRYGVPFRPLLIPMAMLVVKGLATAWIRPQPPDCLGKT